MTARFSLPLPTVEGVCPIQVQPHPREPFFQLSWVGGIVKQSVHPKVFHLLVCLRNIPIQRLEGWRKRVFFCLRIQWEMELADTALFPRLHKEIGKPGNRRSFKARTRGWYFSLSPPEELLISSCFAETQEGMCAGSWESCSLLTGWEERRKGQEQSVFTKAMYSQLCVAAECSCFHSQLAFCGSEYQSTK